jgi:hypothetical protein
MKQTGKFFKHFSKTEGRDREVGVDTRYGLDGPGIGSRSDGSFPHPPRPALEPTQPPIMCPRSSPGGKAAGVWR